MTADVAAAFAAFPPGERAVLLRIRRLLFERAAAEAVGPLTETLKWGEPAYLTAASRSGSTVRLGLPRRAPGHCAVFVNCRTDLLDRFRQFFAAELTFEGDRAILLDPRQPLPEGALGACLGMALTYHRDKQTGGPPRLSPARTRRK